MSKRPKITGTEAPAQKEHIFAASYLEPLAIRWKELNAEGKHTEAMAVLEEIVVGSTQMFQQMAQYEGYHYTVDLDILVSAAQEKVVKWLLKWQRKKGRLFSWFSQEISFPPDPQHHQRLRVKELGQFNGNTIAVGRPFDCRELVVVVVQDALDQEMDAADFLRVAPPASQVGQAGAGFGSDFVAVDIGVIAVIEFFEIIARDVITFTKLIYLN